MKAALLLLTGIGLTGCATATDSFKGPNGRAAYVVRCGSAVLVRATRRLEPSARPDTVRLTVMAQLSSFQ
jgi:hypothetical protein